MAELRDGEHPQDLQSPEEQRLVRSLRSGDEAAFRQLIELHHNALVRLARTYVGMPAVAEEVAQETWVAVLQGLERFEGRSTLKTWIFRILTNRAKTRAEREGRTLPVSALERVPDPNERAVDPDRFFARFELGRTGWWATPPRSWREVPEERLLARETQAVIGRTIEALPAKQRAVISLRDVEGWSSEEVCSTLELSEANQRVLLHRARSAVRAALERYLDEEGAR